MRQKCNLSSWGFAIIVMCASGVTAEPAGKFVYKDEISGIRIHFDKAKLRIIASDSADNMLWCRDLQSVQAADEVKISVDNATLAISVSGRLIAKVDVRTGVSEKVPGISPQSENTSSPDIVAARFLSSYRRADINALISLMSPNALAEFKKQILSKVERARLDGPNLRLGVTFHEGDDPTHIAKEDFFAAVLEQTLKMIDKPIQNRPPAPKEWEVVGYLLDGNKNALVVYSDRQSTIRGDYVLHMELTPKGWKVGLSFFSFIFADECRFLFK